MTKHVLSCYHNVAAVSRGADGLAESGAARITLTKGDPARRPGGVERATCGFWDGPRTECDTRVTCCENVSAVGFTLGEMGRGSGSPI